MTIKVGDTLPSVTLKHCPYDPALEHACGLPQNLDISSFRGKKVIIFGVPGAFTPTCNNQHVPEFYAKYNEFKARGIDEIICLSTTDAFVMDAWGKWTHTNDKIIFAADGNAEFVHATGLVLDLTVAGMGANRSQRFALVADDLVVKYIGVETNGSIVTVSGADAVLAAL
ncbi:hypothetical protein BGZ99_007523 [Dissophora globulifera]|uniref:Thioredoxin-dependent peroxiredoxin n=1 Tax=Dissophora globulifera TaxID=979702 RepID=A0A9P6R9K6_9FUNG|nr:hypothetical protein BGZ99_007523 [Dissophora globulifera]